MQAQFGSNYGAHLELFELDSDKQIKAEAQARYDFKRKFIYQLKNILLYYPEPEEHLKIDSNFFTLSNKK